MDTKTLITRLYMVLDNDFQEHYTLDDILDNAGIFNEENREYIRENYDELLTVWHSYRERRLTEAMGVLEMEEDISIENLMDFYNSLPANDD